MNKFFDYMKDTGQNWVLEKTSFFGRATMRLSKITKVYDKSFVVDGTRQYSHEGNSFIDDSRILPLTVENYLLYLEDDIKGRVLHLYGIACTSTNKSKLAMDSSLELTIKATQHILKDFPNLIDSIEVIQRQLESYNKMLKRSTKEYVYLTSLKDL